MCNHESIMCGRVLTLFLVFHCLVRSGIFQFFSSSAFCRSLRRVENAALVLYVPVAVRGCIVAGFSGFRAKLVNRWYVVGW